MSNPQIQLILRDRRTSIDEQDMFLYLIDRVGTQIDVFTRMAPLPSKVHP